jgi:hypothetical protein
MRSTLLALLTLVALVLLPTGVAGAHGITLGFFDGSFTNGDPAVAEQWFSRAQSTGSQVVRMMPAWSSIAPKTKAATFDPANPDDPGYKWTVLDAEVREATAHGQHIIFTIFNAPLWAQGDDRPSSGKNVNWKVDPMAVAAFATALAKRYSGTHVDPTNPAATLPRITDWQVWNEPNIYTTLNPQWVRSDGKWVAYSPARYRDILNQAFAALKSVSASNRVITAGTAPFGDPDPGGDRIMPLKFWRLFLCLDPSTGCATPAHFDVASHHPYSVRGPTAHAANADDASVADVAKVWALVKKATSSGKALPRTSKPMWVTELSWDTNPPDPQGIPVSVQARWLAQSAYVLWKQGVSLLAWYQIGDAAASSAAQYAASNQGGVYYADGREKASAAAFRFPFLVRASGKARSAAWGVAPAPGTVVIERRRGATWEAVATAHVGSDRILSVSLPLRGGTFRARAGTVVSPSWP